MKPTKQHEALSFERKIPKQARARNTREVIFEAAARIIEEHDSFNTNAIAARAGISIGTLYGHFASKEAVLVSMARQQLVHDEAAVVSAVCWQAIPGVARIPAAVNTLIALHRDRPEVRSAIFAAHAAQGLSHERSAVVLRAAQRIMEWRTQAGHRPVDGSALFVATHALVGTVRAAFEEASPLLGTPEFADRLAGLVETALHPFANDERGGRVLEARTPQGASRRGFRRK